MPLASLIPRVPLFLGLALGVLLAVVLRLHLAWSYFGNFDQESYDIVRQIFAHHGNVYAETTRYNYSPVWYLTLGMLGTLADLTGWSFHFCVRGFLTLVDLGTAGLLAWVARSMGLVPWRAVLLFLLNPVTLLVTGYHGQFDNMAVLFLVASLGIQYAKPQLTNWDKGFAWGLAATAVLVKQIVIFAPYFILRRAFPDWRVRFVVASAASLPFFLSFLPFLPGGLDGIRHNVFAYSGIPGLYGLTTLHPTLTAPGALSTIKILMFIALLGVGLFLRRCQPVRAALLCSLIFLVLSPGIGEQYFILPIVFGALCPSLPFALYSLTAGAFLLASSNNLAWEPLRGHIPWNWVWYAAVIWLAREFWCHGRAAREPASEPSSSEAPVRANASI